MSQEHSSRGGGVAVVILDQRGAVSSCNGEGAAFLKRIAAPESGPLSSGPNESVTRLVEAVLGKEREVAELAIEIDAIPYVLTVSPLSPPRRDAWAVLEAREMTIEKRLTDRCRQLDRYDGFERLIPSVVHDVRNPLTAASTLVETCLLMSQLDAPSQKRLGDAVQNIERANEILTNLSNFSRDESPTFHPSSLNSMVEKTVELQRSTLMRRRIEVVLKLDPSQPNVYADPSQLRQVVVNLISNAADAITESGQPGTIEITTSNRLGVVRLSVDDDGPGISAKIASRIFEPYFTTKDKGKGTGLGLAISSGIAKTHGGHLWLRARRPHGASFVLDLPDPRSMMPAKDRSFLGVSQAKQPALLALVVEPDARQVEVTSQFLRRCRYTVHVTPSGMGALRKLRATTFQLVVSADELEDMSGEELMKQAQRIDSEIAQRFIITSGDPSAASIQRFVATSGIASLKKPYGAQELGELLESLQAVV